MRKTTASPPKTKTGATSPSAANQIVIQNAYGQTQQPQQQQNQAHQQQNQNSQGGGGQGQVAAQANQMLVKRQLVFTQEQLLELQRAGRFGKQPVPQEYAVIQPQAQEFRGRKTLVLDLDETLIHSKFSEAHLRACRTRGRCDFQMRIVVEGRPIQVYVLIRPGVLFFLQKLASIYEIVLYTASMSIYANPLVDTLDQDQLIPMRLYREHCFSFQGSYIKDLSLLGRDMKDVIIVDNSPNAYYFHNENAVPILSWYDDPDDRCLFEMIPLLEALSQVHDVRQVIPKFVRKDINLVDFPKAAWVLNDAYRQMHSAPVNGSEGAAGPAAAPTAEEAASKNNSKKVLTPTKQQSAGTQGSNQTPSKQAQQKSAKNAALEDAYERKPSPINLKPLSPRATNNKLAGKTAGDDAQGSQATASSDVKITSRKERTFSPRQLKISSKQQVQEIDSQSIQQQQQQQQQHEAEQAKRGVQKKRSDTASGKDLEAADNTARRESRGKSQNPGGSHRGGHFSPISGGKDADPDEVAIDQVQRRSRRKVSHQMKQNESSDLEVAANAERQQRLAGTQDALENGLAAEATANNQLYQKVSQRKQIIQRHMGQPPQIGAVRRRPSAQNNGGVPDSSDTSRMSSPQNTSTTNAGSGPGSKNTSFTQGTRVGGQGTHNVQLEINTNKAELAAGGPLVDLPPHLQKIMQARSTTNKTSSMARQGIVIPQGNIITPVNGGKLGNSHRIGTSNGKGESGNGAVGTGLNATFQNIPKSNNLFQTSQTDTSANVENLSQKRLHATGQTAQNSVANNLGKKQGATENLNRSFSNQAGVTNGSLSTQNNNSQNTSSNTSNIVTTGANGHQSSTTWASRQQMAAGLAQQAPQSTSSRDGGGGVMQHSSRLNGRRKLSRNEQAASSTTPGSQGSSQINVQGNLSIRRGITRYQQATSHTRNAEPHNISGVMSSRNESQQQHQSSHQPGNVKLIGKNSLHMKRRSEYPNESSQSNQWHLPDASGSSGGIITSESQKNTAAPGFNFQKQAPNAAWVPSSGAPPGTQQQPSQQQVQHSQSSNNGVSSTSHNQKRVINQSVGQLSNVKHINSANLANVPATTGHKKVQSLLSNIQQRDNQTGRAIHIMQPGVSNTQPGSGNLNTSGLGSQSSSTRHRKPPMLVRPNHPQRMGVSQVPGTQPNSTQNRNRNRDQWMNFANIMHQNVPTDNAASAAAAAAQNQSNLTPMNSMGGHKLSSDFIVKNGSATAAAQAAVSPNTTSPTGPSKQNYLGLMQTQPAIGAGAAGSTKAKFKQAKPLTNTRGKSVPQERPSNSQGNVNIANAALTGGGPHGEHAGAVGGHAGQSATKSSTGIRISSQRQQFISSSNKTIKTLKQFNQATGRQQPHTADQHQQK